jgi:thiol-disulfide isomerase/thioredoxin
MKNLLIAFAISLVAIHQGYSQNKSFSDFSQSMTADSLITYEGEEIKLQQILDKHKGKIVLIDFWASWCKDCIQGIDGIKKLQKQYKDNEVVFLFLSLDREQDKWKNAISHYDLKGDHYFIKGGWKNCVICKDIELDWIPRYMVVDKKGEISLYRAIKSTDPDIKKAINGLIGEI